MVLTSTSRVEGAYPSLHDGPVRIGSDKPWNCGTRYKKLTEASARKTEKFLEITDPSSLCVICDVNCFWDFLHSQMTILYPQAGGNLSSIRALLYLPCVHLGCGRGGSPPAFRGGGKILPESGGTFARAVG